MPILSKLFANVFGFRLMHATCYEFGHTWNPSCFFAITDALNDSFSFCLKTYGILYTVCHVIFLILFIFTKQTI